VDKPDHAWYFLLRIGSPFPSATRGQEHISDPVATLVRVRVRVRIRVRVRVRVRVGLGLGLGMSTAHVPSRSGLG